MAVTWIDLRTLADAYEMPYGTVARWALHERWPAVVARSQRLGTPALYDIDVVVKLAGIRLEARKREAIQRKAA